jgi:hypothetical protein
LYDNNFNKKLEADIILGRGMNQMSSNQYLYAAWNMRKAWKLFESLSKKYLENEEKIDINDDAMASLKFGVGIFYWIIGLIPNDFFQKALGFIGFVADYDKGIKLITEASTYETVKKPFINMVLSMNYLMIPSTLGK